MSLTISGYAWAKRHKRKFPAVITIEDPDTRFGLRFHRNPSPEHLILKFADLDYAVPEPYDNSIPFRMATVEHINDALKFARNFEDLLVHCQVGISRSTALALGILMDRLGAESAAYAELDRIRPKAVPNKHVLTLVDHILGSNLISLLDTWDSRNQWSLLRRKLCRRAYFLHGGIPLLLEPELITINPLLPQQS